MSPDEPNREVLSQLPAEVQQLGTPLSVHSTRRFRLVANLVIHFVLECGLGALLLFGCIKGVGDLQWAKLRWYEPLILLGFFAFGVTFIVDGVWRGWKILPDRKLQVLLFPDGLAALRGDRAEIFRWDDITAAWELTVEVYQGSSLVNTHYACMVERKDGARLTCTYFLADGQVLCEAVRRETVSRLLPPAVKTLEAGETLRFGPLSLSPGGLSDSMSDMPWGALEVVLEKGRIKVRERGGWLPLIDVRSSKVPNVYVFLALVDHIVGIKEKK